MLRHIGAARTAIRRRNEDFDVINSATKFSISVDVSQFKPEELHVHVNGRLLIVEAKPEKQRDDGRAAQKPFMHRWTLPDDADLDAVTTTLTDVGRLLIESPKTGRNTLKRELPINVAERSSSAPTSPTSRIVVIN